MKYQLLLLAFLSSALGSSAQQFEKVDKSKYKDYTPTYAPDPSLMRNISGRADKAGMRTRATRASLPAYVNNANAKWFPPIFGQTGGSCGASSRIGYMMTYEWNAFRLSDASKIEHRLPPHFEYPFSYNGLSKDYMARYIGYPTGDVYGGWDISSIYGAYEVDSNDAGWMQGYECWHNAMFNRITGTANFPKGSDTPEGMEAIKRWLFNHNGDPSWPTVTDENGTHIVGGIAGLGCGISGCVIKPVADVEANRKAGVVGKHYIERWRYDTADHAITLVGYDDRVVFDLDKNGVYGEAKNRLGQDERGAWIFANSWGTGFADKGLCYVPYPMAGGVTNSKTGKHTLTNDDGSLVEAYTGGGWWPELYYLRQNYVPQQTMKVTMQYSKRSEISVKVGVSQDPTATKPDKESVFMYINYTGDGDKDPADAETPLLGRWADGKMHYEPMEFGVDLTDLCEGIDFSRPVKYFLTINSKGSATGKGSVKSVSIIDYAMNEKGVEMPICTEDVPIKNGGQTTCVSGVVRQESVNAPYNLAFDDNKQLTWAEPVNGLSKPETYIVYQSGNKITETTSTHYAPTSTDGSFYVKASYKINGKQKLSAASNSAALPQNADAVYDNDVLQFTSSGGFIVPNVTATPHQKFTIEYWLKPSSVRDWNQKVGAGWGTFWLHANNNRKLTFGWNTQNGNRSDSEPILEANKWTHIALVIDGNTMTLYANGERKGQFSSQFHSGMPAISDGLLFGATNNDGLHGCIDDLRIWEVARTAQEIKDNYQTPIANPGSEKGLLAYFKMNTINKNGNVLLVDAAHGNHAKFLPNGAHNTAQANNETIRKQTLSPAAIQGPTQVNKGDVVTLSATTSVGVMKRTWTATGATPAQTTAHDASFKFNAAGNQTVTLTTTDINGQTQQTTHQVNVKAIEPSADFTITNETVKASERVSFLAKNEVSGCTYAWQLDGADIKTSDHRNISAVFMKAGTHTVTLTVTSAEGKKYTQTKRLNVATSAPKAGYKTSKDDQVVLKNEEVTLTDASKYEPTEFYWSLVSNNQVYNGTGNPYRFKPQRAGVYKLYYTVENAQGSDKLVKEQAVIVCNADAQRGLNFSTVGNKSYKTMTTGQLDNISSDWTIDYWLKPTFASSASNGIYALNTNGSEVASLMAQPKGGATLKVGDQTFQISDDFIISGQWHHYAITANKTTVNLYRDGTLFKSFTLSGDNGTDNVSKVRIGGEAQADGIFDEFRVWGKTLSQADLRRYCTAPLSGDELSKAVSGNQLKCYYQFNTTEIGTSIPDQSGQGCNATRDNFGPGGDAWVSSRGVFAIDFSPAEGEKINGYKSLDRSSYRIVKVSDEETQSEQNGNGFAELALDTDEDTYWHSQYAGGEKGFPHSFTIDRASLDVIHALKITNKRESRYRAVSVTVEQSDDMNQWEMLDNNHHFLDMESPAVNLMKPVTKRYMRLTFNENASQGSLMTLNTVEFYGTKANDASLEQPVRLIFKNCSDEGEKSNQKAINAVDGKDNTQWRSKEGIPYPHTIDVQNSSKGRCIERLYLVQAKIGDRQQNRSNNAGKATIWVSNNGKDWTAYEKVRIPYYNKSTIRLKIPIFQPYIRFEFTEAQMKGATSLALKEIKAYGRLSNETGINGVAQNRNSTDTRIYNLQGQYVGTSINSLPAGIYIRGGKKVVIP